MVYHPIRDVTEKFKTHNTRGTTWYDYDAWTVMRSCIKPTKSATFKYAAYIPYTVPRTIKMLIFF